jgi:hypothetical protein
VTNRLAHGLSRQNVAWSAVAGVAIGVAYTLSPLTVVFAVAIVLMWRWAGRGVPAGELRWLYALLAVAIVLRVAAVAALFMSTNHHQVGFGTLFGDEEYFLRRALWRSKIALDIPVSGADFIYAYEDYGRTSYMYVLALADLLFGPSPYGAHLLSAAAYVAGSILLYRLVRPSFGSPASLLGLALLLFLPSLFAWSISALKESVFFLVMSVQLALAVAFVRHRSWAWRLGAACALVVVAFLAQSVRDAGLVLAGVSAGAGVALAFALARPRVAVALALAAIIVVPVAATRAKIEDRWMDGIRAAAFTNWGHVNTAGYVYKTMSPYIYEDRGKLTLMTPQEAGQFVVRALVSYVVVPAPWQVQSTAALAFLPEQTVWYALVAFAPFGLLAALRRDRSLACQLVSFTLVAAVLVALSTGNIGTLVRHRGLALPYLIWFSALGVCDLAARYGNRAAPFSRDAHVNG